MPEPGQAQPTSQAQPATPVQPQATPQVSDKTIDAFMAVDDNKKRDALSKMSEPTKQALLQGIKARKGVQTTPAQPPKPEGFIDKAKQFMGAGPSIPAKPLTDTEKANPFTSGIASGSMMDPSKLSTTKTTGEFAKEYASQVGSGMKQFGESILKDPLNVGNAIDSITASQAQAYRKVRDGLKSGDHDLLMNGLGEAVGDLSLLLGGAKSAKEGLGVKSLGSSTKFAAKDITAKRAIVSAASNEYLDALKETHSKTIDAGIAAENAKIGANVNAINIADVAKDPTGFKPTIDVANKLNDSVTTKKASVMLQEGKLPKTSQLKSLIAGHGPNLTFNDLKYIRTVAEGLQAKADGVDYAILTDNIKYLTDEMKSRAGSLGKIKELEDYNNNTIKVKGLEKGIVADLKNTKNGLAYAKEIVQGSNKGQLDKIIQGLHLPTDFFSDAVKEHKTLINYAKMSEGDSVVANVVNRAIALRSHLMGAGLGAAAGVQVGKAFGSLIGSPMAGSIVGFTLGTGMAHELLSKYDAAKTIREMGGPSNFRGVPKFTPPSSGQAPTSGSNSSPSTGPDGGGNGPSPTKPPVTPSGSPPSDISMSPETQAQARAALEAKSKSATVGGREAKGAEAANAVSENKPFQQQQFDTAISKTKEIIRDPKATPEEKSIAKDQLKSYREQAAKLADEPKVTKVSPEARGQRPSLRKNLKEPLLVDTKETRNAKAAAKKASDRASGKLATEVSGGDVAGKAASLAEQRVQSKMINGLISRESLNNLMPEDIANSLKNHGKRGALFLKALDRASKEQKWGVEQYKAGLMETYQTLLELEAKDKAVESEVPGLKKD